MNESILETATTAQIIFGSFASIAALALIFRIARKIAMRIAPSDYEDKETKDYWKNRGAD